MQGERVVPIGGRVVRLSVLIAVIAVAAAAVLSWRLFLPTYVGGVGGSAPSKPPPMDVMEGAPGPDNRATTLPPLPPVESGGGKKVESR